jgi:hypothetical protein
MGYGVGSRFRATIYHREAAHPKTTPDPFPPDSTKKYLAGRLYRAVPRPSRSAREPREGCHVIRRSLDCLTVISQLPL